MAHEPHHAQRSAVTRPHRALALGILALLLAAGCRSLAAADAVPARLLDPDAAARAELHAVVAAALHRDSILLADDALVGSSLLVIERAPARDAAGRPLQGRELGPPWRFRLWLDGGRCVLEQLDGGGRTPLAHAHCVAQAR
jgi:hypothetical protein